MGTGGGGGRKTSRFEVGAKQNARSRASSVDSTQHEDEDQASSANPDKRIPRSAPIKRLVVEEPQECVNLDGLHRCEDAPVKDFDSFTKAFQKEFQVVVTQCAQLCFVGVHPNAKKMFSQLGIKGGFAKGVDLVVKEMLEQPPSAKYRMLFPFIALTLVVPDPWPPCEKPAKVSVCIYMCSWNDDKYNDIKCELFLLCAKKAAIALRHVESVDALDRRENVMNVQATACSQTKVKAFYNQVSRCDVGPALEGENRNLPTLYLWTLASSSGRQIEQCGVVIKLVSTYKANGPRDPRDVRLYHPGDLKDIHKRFAKSPNMKGKFACMVGIDDALFTEPAEFTTLLKTIVAQRKFEARRVEAARLRNEEEAVSAKKAQELQKQQDEAKAQRLADRAKQQQERANEARRLNELINMSLEEQHQRTAEALEAEKRHEQEQQQEIQRIQEAQKQQALDKDDKDAQSEDDESSLGAFLRDAHPSFVQETDAPARDSEPGGGAEGDDAKQQAEREQARP